MQIVNAEGSEPPATTRRAPDLTAEIERIHAAKAGDASAFGELIRANDAKMRGLAYRLVGDRTVMDDVLQDAYLKAFRSLHTYEPSGARFSSWLYRVVHSCAMDHHRKARRQPASSTEVNAELPTTDADLSTAIAQRSALRAALLDLPDDQAVVVALVDGEGLSYDETAEILDISSGTVGSRLSRAHAVLRRQLNSDGKVAP